MTGATSGIGRAVAVAMGAAGAKVVAVGRDLDRLDEVTTRLEGVGAEARAVRADLLDDAARHRVLDETTRVFGRLDVLVHSAAVFERRPFGTVGAESLDFHWATNTRVPFLLTEAALPRLEPGGSVLFLTSTVSRIGFADTAAYAMSKAAIDALTRVLAVECGPRGIRVNAISPGWIATPMNEETRRDPATTQTAIAATPLGRLGTPEDVAPAAVFLASDNARFITGATICVEAGYPALPVSPAAVRSTAFTMPS